MRRALLFAIVVEVDPLSFLLFGARFEKGASPSNQLIISKRLAGCPNVFVWCLSLVPHLEVIQKGWLVFICAHDSETSPSEAMRA